MFANSFPHSSSAAAAQVAKDEECAARIQMYFTWVDHFRAKVIPEAAVAFQVLSVRTLKINPTNTTITPQDLLPIAEMLKYDNIITDLDLSGVPIGDSGAYILADMLHLSHLRVLNLANCQIGECGAVILLKSIVKNAPPYLQKLSLYGNRIGYRGAIQLGLLLQKSRTLELVDVRNNLLRSQGLREITSALLLRASNREELLKTRLAALSAQKLANEQAFLAPRANEIDATPSEHRSTLPSSTLDDNPPESDETSRVIPGTRRGKSSRSKSMDKSDAKAPRKALEPARGGWGWLLGEPTGLTVTTNFAVIPQWRDDTPSFTSSSNDAPTSLKVRNTPDKLNKGRRSNSLRPIAPGNNTIPEQSDPHSSWNNFRSPPIQNTPLPPDCVDIEVLVSGNHIAMETLSSVVHALGLLATVILTFPLLAKGQASESAAETIGYIIYLFSLAAWFSASLLHHSLFLLDSSYFFKRISPSTVFILIAGTYTPWLLGNFRKSVLSPILLTAVWALAIFGAVFLPTCVRDVTIIRRMRLLLYFVVGWIGVVPYLLLPSCLPVEAWKLIAWGGIVFSSGILLYLRDRLRMDTRDSMAFPAWYFLVLAACGAHYLAIYHYVQSPSEECIAAERNAIWSHNFPIQLVSSFFTSIA